MARGSINKVMLIGNLGGDPEVRYMTNGDPVTSFSLAKLKPYFVVLFYLMISEHQNFGVVRSSA